MEAVAKDREAVPEDREAGPEDREAVPEDGEAVPEDGEAVPGDREAEAEDGKAVPEDRKAVPMPVPVPMPGVLLMFEYINFTSRSGQCQIRVSFVFVVSEKIIYIKSYDYWLFGNIMLVQKFTKMHPCILSPIFDFLVLDFKQVIHPCSCSTMFFSR
jgi:hypothetical protein